MLKIITYIVAFYLLYCGLLFFLQRQIIFPRHYAEPVPQVSQKISELEKIWLELSFGKVESWFMPPMAEGKRPVLIFAHGNAELIDHWPKVLKPLTRSGFGIYLVEYPGYGRSQGIPSQDTVVETFTAAYDFIIDRPEVDKKRVVFWGRSLGGGAVCALAEKRTPAAMILMSTFTSISGMAIKFGVPGFFVRDPFDNLKTVEAFDGPVLVIHGKHDEVIPYSHGEKLYKAAAQGKLITYPCGHNDCPPDWDRFFEDIKRFLTTMEVQNGKNS
jgi:fermentation-respiration switch protein FrsA (DUF1100 family)